MPTHQITFRPAEVLTIFLDTYREELAIMIIIMVVVMIGKKMKVSLDKMAMQHIL